MSHRRRSCDKQKCVVICCPEAVCICGVPGDDQADLPVGTVLTNVAGGPGTTLFVKTGPGPDGWTNVA